MYASQALILQILRILLRTVRILAMAILQTDRVLHAFSVECNVHESVCDQARVEGKINGRFDREAHSWAAVPAKHHVRRLRCYLSPAFGLLAR